MQKYLHVGPISNIEQILDRWIIDNTVIPQEDTFAWKERWEFVVQVWNTLELVRAFMWDITKIQESGYTKTAPWEDDVFVDKRFRFGKTLWLLPRIVHRYKVEEFRAIVFDVSQKVQATIFDMHMIDQDDGRRFYFESATHLPVQMQNT